MSTYRDPVDELLAASDLAAVYFTGSQGPNAEGTLRITGKYSATNPVEFVRFQRENLPGGLSYEVRGLVYNPALEKYTRPIPDHDTTIKLPSEVIPGGTIAIITKNGRVEVKITYLEGSAIPFPESNDATIPPIDANNNATIGEAPKDVLLKASDLDATYYKKSQTLRLNGKFTADRPVQFARFSVKKDGMGGIAYEVRGFQWNPVVEQYTKQIPAHDRIIELPNRVVPANTVVFFGTGDEQITVHIKMLDTVAPPFIDSDSVSDIWTGVDQQEPSPIGAQQANTEAVPPPHDTLLEGKDLKATYHLLLGGPGTLVLEGKYTACNPVDDARFVRVNWLGGLAFDVRGNVAWPVVKEYTGDVKTWSQKLALPDYVKNIVFFIAGGKSVVVPIEFTEAPPSLVVLDSLLDASNLRAVYYSVLAGTGTLVLDGEYTSETIVNDPHFQRELCIGGLKFGVWGSVTPYGVMPRPLPIKQFSEGMDDLRTKDVIFVVKGGKEIIVPIEFKYGPLPSSSTKQVLSGTEFQPVFTQTGFQPVTSQTESNSGFSQTGFQPTFTQTGFQPVQSQGDLRPVLSLLQASDLAAFYIFDLGSNVGTLTLSGNYTARNPVLDAHFERKQDWVGGLAYSVEGIVESPAVLEYTRPIKGLSVQMPFVDVFPSKHIVFFTEQGKQTVPIEFVPLMVPPTIPTSIGATDIKQPLVSTREISPPLSEVN